MIDVIVDVRTYDIFVGVHMTSLSVFTQTIAYSSLVLSKTALPELTKPLRNVNKIISGFHISHHGIILIFLNHFFSVEWCF